MYHDVSQLAYTEDDSKKARSVDAGKTQDDDGKALDAVQVKVEKSETANANTTEKAIVS